MSGWQEYSSDESVDWDPYDGLHAEKQAINNISMSKKHLLSISRIKKILCQNMCKNNTQSFVRYYKVQLCCNIIMYLLCLCFMLILFGIFKSKSQVTFAKIFFFINIIPMLIKIINFLL